MAEIRSELIDRVLLDVWNAQVAINEDFLEIEDSAQWALIDSLAKQRIKLSPEEEEYLRVKLDQLWCETFPVAATTLGCEKEELGDALEAYTNPASPEYDAEFDRKIRTRRPDWFGETAHN
jgi:hypothetical protein